MYARVRVVGEFREERELTGEGTMSVWGAEREEEVTGEGK